MQTIGVLWYYLPQYSLPWWSLSPSLLPQPLWWNYIWSFGQKITPPHSTGNIFISFSSQYSLRLLLGPLADLMEPETDLGGLPVHALLFSTLYRVYSLSFLFLFFHYLYLSFPISICTISKYILLWSLFVDKSIPTSYYFLYIFLSIPILSSLCILLTNMPKHQYGHWHLGTSAFKKLCLSPLRLQRTLIKSMHPLTSSRHAGRHLMTSLHCSSPIPHYVAPPNIRKRGIHLQHQTIKCVS